MTEDKTIKQENFDQMDEQEIKELFEQLDSYTPKDSMLNNVLSQEPDIMELEVPAFNGEKANNYLFVIGRLNNEIQECQEMADRQIKKTESWLTDETQKREKIIQFLNNKLHAFIVGEDKKTINLPNGSLKMRSAQDKVEVLDFDQFKEFCNEQGRPDLIRTKVSEDPDKKQIKKYIKESGCIPDGCDLVKNPDKFTSKPDLD